MAKRAQTQKADAELIQGLWRVVSYISRGDSVMSGTTHYQFDGNRVKEIDPFFVEGGEWATFRLYPKARPKRIAITYKSRGKSGKTVSRVHREAYALKGNTLRICEPSEWGVYPDVISDKEHSIVTLARDHGPLPETKKTANKKPIRDRVLGRVVWDDDFDHWDATVSVKPRHRITLHLDPGGRTDEATLAAGRSYLNWLRKHEAAARRYAAEQLLDVHNDNWNNGDPISTGIFASRMKLETASVSGDGRSSLYYHDGDLFWGHCIIVRVTNKQKFDDTEIAG